MCGVVGVYYFNRQENLNSASVDKMLESIQHRGPDQQGSKILNDKVILGMNRLAIVNNDQEDLPYQNSDHSLTLSFNGQFYNYKDYESNLKKTYEYKHESDTETLLHCFEEYGLDILKDINGMYSIALYDSKLDELTLIRDKAGEKFLYYFEDHEKVVFASEIKAILQIVLGKEVESLSYEMFEACFGHDTLFQNIKLIEPGHYVKFQGKKSNYISYWNVFDNLLDVPDDLEQIEKDLTDLIVDAVEVRTSSSTYPYGCLVSGGVDSALVACIKKPEFLYTTTYKDYNFGEGFDELQYALDVAKHIKKDIKIIKPTKEEYEEYRRDIAYHLDTPSTWTSFNYYVTFKEVAKDTRVALMGEGVDELFGGYHRYHFLNHDQQILQLDALKNYDYLIGKYYGDPIDRYIRLINRSDKIELKKYHDYMRKIVSPYFDGFNDVVHSMGAFDFYTTMQIILQMSDRMSMAHSVESRSPFLDHRLIQYAYSMPSKYKINNGITKYIIKKIAAKFIPQSIIERKDKRGFVAPINKWYGYDKVKNQYDRSGYREMAYQDWKYNFIKG